MQTELLALAAFDRIGIHNRNPDVSTSLKNFFTACWKLSPSREAKVPLAFFGGLGLLIFRSMETNASVKKFRVQSDVQRRLSNVCDLLGVSIDSADQLGNLLSDLRQVIFILGTDSRVDKMALMALIRRAWREVSGSENEDSDFHIRNLDNNDFGEVEAATLVDFFSATSEPSCGKSGTLHLDALEYDDILPTYILLESK